MGDIHTMCKKCGRVVWATDVDRDGNCILCVPPKAEVHPEPFEDAGTASEDK